MILYYILYYIYYIILYYIRLDYNILYYIILHYITLYYITLYYITLHYIIFYYITLYEEYVNYIGNIWWFKQQSWEDHGGDPRFLANQLIWLIWGCLKTGNYGFTMFYPPVVAMWK